LAARREGDVLVAQEPNRRRDQLSPDRHGGAVAGAALAATAGGRLGVVQAGQLRVIQLAAQEGHQAAVGGQVLEHGCLLGPPGRCHPPVAVGVVDPTRIPAQVATVDPPDGALDIQDLEQLVQPALAQVDLALQLG
jgi:hypothetical protein